AQFGGRLLGEGDGGDLLDGHPVGEQERAEAPDEGVGLAGPGAGFDEEGGRGVRFDAVAGALVGQRRAGGLGGGLGGQASRSVPVSSRAASATMPANAGCEAKGSCRDNCSQARSRSPPPRMSARSRADPRPPLSGNHPFSMASTRAPTSARTASISASSMVRETWSNSPRSVQYQ